jgi:phosphate:Na+ symporter
MVTALLGLYGGLGLFIFGMQSLSDGLQRAAGDKFRQLLERLTGTLPKGLLVGMAVTSLIQSSSATTVMVVGLVNAGMMTLMQAVGVIFGANIGTTITAQLVAFKLTDLALPAIGLGFTLSFFGRRARLKRIGEVLLGFGLLFLGMKLMGQYLGPMIKEPWARQLMTEFAEHPVLGVLVGAAITAIVQSSSATTGLIIALAAEGAIGLVAAVPLVLGANIGTCITALLASIGSSVMAKRSAVVHLLFNVIGVVFMVPFVLQFERLVGGLGGSVPRQIANAHTLFNVTVSLVLLPFAARLAQLATALVPGKVEEFAPGPRYIDVRFLSTPALALAQARKEALRMGEFVLESLRMTFAGLLRKDAGVKAKMDANEQTINGLERAITDYLANLAAQELAEEDSRRVANLLLAVKDLERVGDHAESLARLVEMKAEDDISFSTEAEREIQAMFELVDRAVSGALRVMANGQDDGSDQIWGLENELDIMEKDLRVAHIRRLGDRICSPAAGIIFLDVASHFERIGDHAANIGRLMAGLWSD